MSTDVKPVNVPPTHVVAEARRDAITSSNSLAEAAPKTELPASAGCHKVCMWFPALASGIVILLLQLIYAWSLYSSDPVYVNAAANIGSHYIASNLLLFGFLHLWVRSHFWLAELFIIINFFNLSFAYFRHSTTPRPIHIGTVAGPLAWNFVALYWVGARAVPHTDALPARIVGNIFIWGILAYGSFFLVAFKDYTIGFALSYLAFSTGVGQFLTKIPIFQLQWIFAFTIGALLFILSLGVSSGRTPFEGGEVVSEDRERAPLLRDGPDVPREARE
ncbi:hypothetical protein SLS60_011421 [Paraconiothyrium brasiliense]|uniref:DUF1774-domain-containing protein n=1 Tax=Paraconiothyrium brasiliense TaxID=300254 RepID=A0ABR3QJK9_9PLEO